MTTAAATTAVGTSAAGAPSVAAAGVAGTPQLRYHGGPVVSSAEVVQVLYGAGTYLPQVTGNAAGQANVPNFLRHLLTSGYVTELREYDTDITSVTGHAGTGQHIGPGTFAGQVAITPAPSRNGATVYDDEIQAELAAQIAAGVLPAPRADGGGHARTVYSVFLRRAQRACERGSGMCSLQAGGFCAYHAAFRLDAGTGPTVLYTVQPDLAGFSGRGCGYGDDLAVTTGALSHEIAEVITDPEVSLASTYDRPLAWYDPVFLGENADLCDQRYGPLVLGGQTYQVQQTWSNAARACVTMSVAAAAGEFELQPDRLAVLAGSTATTSLRLLGAGPVTPTVSGLPAGVSATLAPAVLAAPGATAELTLTAAPDAAPGTATVTVATAAPAAFSATFTLSVVAPGGSARSALDVTAPIERLLDTRTGDPLGPGATQRVHVADAGATAAVLDVVATDATAAGYVTAWPCAEARPLASSVNTVPTRTVANLVTVALGTDGDVCLFNSAGTVHLVIDRFGAYVPVAGPVRAGRFTPVQPVRALDTRSTATPFAPGETRPLDLAATAGVPAEAQAVVLTVTAVDAPADGYWSVWPAGPWPGTSSLNASTGRTVANQAIVPVALGRVLLRSLAGGQVAVDVAGWFTGSTAPEEESGLFQARTPVRALDTRVDGPRSTLALSSVVPTAARAVSLNVTVTQPAADGFLTVYPGEGVRPLASVVNYAAGDTVPGHVAVGVDAGRLGLFTNVPADLVVDVGGWYS